MDSPLPRQVRQGCIGTVRASKRDFVEVGSFSLMLDDSSTLGFTPQYGGREGPSHPSILRALPSFYPSILLSFYASILPSFHFSHVLFIAHVHNRVFTITRSVPCCSLHATVASPPPPPPTFPGVCRDDLIKWYFFEGYT